MYILKNLFACLHHNSFFKTRETLHKAVTILAELLLHDWRNEYDMKRFQGYEILAYMLKKKKTLFTLSLIDSLLLIVGKPLMMAEYDVVPSLPPCYTDQCLAERLPLQMKLHTNTSSLILTFVKTQQQKYRKHSCFSS
jgi:hypothetical protein